MIKTISLILILAAAAFAQTSITDLQAKAKADKLKDLVIKYDKFKDSSVVSTKPYNLIGGGEGFAAAMAVALSRNSTIANDETIMTSLMANVGIVFDGDKLAATADKFILNFETNSNNWVFLKGDRNVYFLFDEQRLELKPFGSDSDIGRRSVSEQLGYEITRADLEKLSSAKKLEMKLGPVPRKVRSEFIDRIRQLLKLTKIEGK